MNINPRVIAIEWTDGNPRIGSARSHRQILFRVNKCIEDLLAAEEVLTIFRGLHEVKNSLHVCDRYA